MNGKRTAQLESVRVSTSTPVGALANIYVGKKALHIHPCAFFLSNWRNPLHRLQDNLGMTLVCIVWAFLIVVND